ncbi:MAG: helix-turn-helix transcriptional regulator [Rhodoblastus sp.]|nr:MAG: helix-turn-helix transcriptional regulator [Rhodoblastus sp.]
MPKLSQTAQAQRRARILDAAERCFVRSGFHGATMQDICRQAGVSAGALYLYFRSKEELIEGLSQRDRAQVREEFARASAQGDLVEGLARVLQSSAIDKPIDKVRLLIEMGAQAGRSAAVSRTLRECDADIRGALEETLAAAAVRADSPDHPDRRSRRHDDDGGRRVVLAARRRSGFRRGRDGPAHSADVRRRDGRRDGASLPPRRRFLRAAARAHPRNRAAR